MSPEAPRRMFRDYSVRARAILIRTNFIRVSDPKCLVLSKEIYGIRYMFVIAVPAAYVL